MYENNHIDVHKFVTSDVTLWHLHMENQGILKWIQLWPSLFPYSISLHLPHFASIPLINIKTCTQNSNNKSIYIACNLKSMYLQDMLDIYILDIHIYISIMMNMAYPQCWINKAWMAVCESCAVGKIVVLFIRTSAPIIAGLGCPRLWHCANGAQRGRSLSLISVFSQASEEKCRVNNDADKKD